MVDIAKAMEVSVGGEPGAEASSVVVSTVPAYYDPLTITQSELADLVQRDRLARKMSWVKYAKFLGMSKSALYRIAMNQTTKTHQVTTGKILTKINGSPA